MIRGDKYTPFVRYNMPFPLNFIQETRTPFAVTNSIHKLKKNTYELFFFIMLNTAEQIVVNTSKFEKHGHWVITNNYGFRITHQFF